MTIYFYIILLLLIVYGILLEYYRRAWNQIPYWDSMRWKEKLPATKVTVIVPARNEEKNIDHCLYALLSQNYPKEMLEIIVVDDHSTDLTAQRVKQINSPQITLLSLEDFVSDMPLHAHKKKAIEVAIEASSGSLIVTTDADCRAPVEWIAAMESFYSNYQAVFIAAPVRILDRGTLLSVFQSLDFISLQGITGAAVYKHIYSMSNGANLAYEKIAFEAVEGFDGIDSIASGDDMLLMYKIDKKFPGRTFFLKTKEAIVDTEPMADWKKFMQQRIRWSSKADKYKDKKIFATLLFVYILNASLIVFLLGSFWDIQRLIFFLLLILIKTLLEFSFVKKVAVFFGQEHLMKYFLFLQPLHILYTVLTGFLGKFAGYEWKDRKIGS
jgi:cellulose synthase/poly-beta-1,6-N-acetylglucosamine synthase-like glycosyltransferase